MPFYTKAKSTDFKPIPEGSYRAVCNAIIDLGIQPGGKYEPSHQLYIRWELCDERYTKDGKSFPVQIGNFYTVSLSEKSNLRKMLQSWRGRSFTETELEKFDLFEQVGQACLLQIIHKNSNGKTYANVYSVMSMPRGGIIPTPELETIKFDLISSGDQEFERVPKWLQEKIANRIQSDVGQDAEALADDDI